MGRRLILDTNVLIAYERGTIDRSSLDDDELAVAAVSIAEYRVGIELADTAARAADRARALAAIASGSMSSSTPKRRLPITPASSPMRAGPAHREALMPSSSRLTPPRPEESSSPATPMPGSATFPTFSPRSPDPCPTHMQGAASQEMVLVEPRGLEPLTPALQTWIDATADQRRLPLTLKTCLSGRIRCCLLLTCIEGSLIDR